MPVPVEAKDVAAGDYSEVKGTIGHVVEHRNPKTNELESIDIYWVNSEQELGVRPEAVFDLVQGWGSHFSSVRPGFKADHEHER